MEQLFGGVQRGLGSGLNYIYELTGSYALAIIILTMGVRAILVPLTIKQTRSMKAMQEVQPQVKAIQSRFKALQQKAKDRVELQQIRMEMNRELQGLYKEKGVNPLGGCLPLVAQMPVFIAMFSIMRAAISIVPGVATLTDGALIPENAFEGKDVGATVCRPYDFATQSVITPGIAGQDPKHVRCVFEDPEDEPQIYAVSDFKDRHGDPIDVPWLVACTPVSVSNGEIKSWSFNCRSALGTGHVPVEGELFDSLSKDGAGIFGMQPGCAANGAGNDLGVRTCTSTKDSAGASGAFPYYLLVGLIVVTSYYQTKQMQGRQPQQSNDQQKMLTRIMPVMFGFISLSIPAGANTYFLASNVWTIGQQYLLFRNQAPVGAPPGPKKKAIQAKEVPDKELKPKPKGDPGAPKGSGSRNKKKKRKRR